MRIIAGLYKGFSLKSFAGRDIRPTPAKVREAVFDILSVKIIESDFLDLFAGTGAMGIEAISRGAKRITFVEIEQNAINIIKANLEKINHDNFSDIIKRDYLYSLKILKSQDRKFDIIFLDPPYYKNISKKVLYEIEKSYILKENSIVVVQHKTNEEVQAKYRYLSFLKEKNYGKTKLTIFSFNN
jgi:16S rRNA (guanine966-N2)-methyltransferase